MPFQYNDYNTKIKQFFSRLEAGYIDNKPMHVASKEKSVFAILEYDEFQKMAAVDLHKQMRERVIVVKGFPHDPQIRFDERGLSTLGPLQSQVPIQGEHSAYFGMFLRTSFRQISLPQSTREYASRMLSPVLQVIFSRMHERATRS